MFGCHGTYILHRTDVSEFNVLTIFDCDGVLVDSETLAAQIFAEQLEGQGIRLAADDCKARFKGFTLDDCLHAIEGEFSYTLPKDFLAELRAATAQRFGERLQPVPGVDGVLSWLYDSGKAVCVASNGGMEKIHHSLHVTGLAEYFKHVFSADQVARGKPEPDLFALAARTLGFKASECIVIEDSATGIAAARRAGMHVLFYSAEGIELDGDVPTFTRMEQLPNMLQNLWTHGPQLK